MADVRLGLGSMQMVTHGFPFVLLAVQEEISNVPLNSLNFGHLKTYCNYPKLERGYTVLK